MDFFSNCYEVGEMFIYWVLKKMYMTIYKFNLYYSCKVFLTLPPSIVYVLVSSIVYSTCICSCFGVVHFVFVFKPQVYGKRENFFFMEPNLLCRTVIGSIPGPASCVYGTMLANNLDS